MTPRSLVALSILFFVPCFTWCEDVTTVATLAAEKTTNAADAIRASTQLPATTPWNLAELSKPPEFRWTDETSRVRQLTYAGEQHRGRASRVFALYASPATLGLTNPEDAKAPFPAVVLVHGGGGTAFPEWAELWAKRGYAAIAMDLGGKNVGDASGPDQSDVTKFGRLDEPVTESWPYHAVANVIRAHSLIRSLPEVDASRTALTGISWGGYLTCIVASLDDRFRAAVPVYGCGFLGDNSHWVGPNFSKMSAEHRVKWLTLYDPSQYLPACRVPILFVNGTNDFAYPLDSYMKSYRLVPGPRNIRVTVNMPHGHSQGWAPAEIGLFIDQHVKGGLSLPKLGPITVANGQASCRLALDEAAAATPPASKSESKSESESKSAPRPAAQSAVKSAVKSAALHFTLDTGAINKRNWKSVEASLNNGVATAPLPAEATVWFMTATDDRGAIVSTEVEIRP